MQRMDMLLWGDLAVLRERAKTSKSAALLPDSASEEERLAWHEHQRFRKAVEQLRPTSKEAIFREYFPDTPDGSYDDIWDRMEMRAQSAERIVRRRTVPIVHKIVVFFCTEYVLPYILVFVKDLMPFDLEMIFYAKVHP